MFVYHLLLSLCSFLCLYPFLSLYLSIFINNVCWCYLFLLTNIFQCCLYHLEIFRMRYTQICNWGFHQWFPLPHTISLSVILSATLFANYAVMSIKSTLWNMETISNNKSSSCKVKVHFIVEFCYINTVQEPSFSCI